MTNPLQHAQQWRSRDTAPKTGEWFLAIRSGEFAPGQPFLPQWLRWGLDGWEQPEEGQTVVQINFDWWLPADALPPAPAEHLREKAHD